MSLLLADRRFFATTRGQILTLLRAEERTVRQLIEQLGVTENAVRQQLTQLERDGLVRQTGTRRGRRRPAFVYGLTPQAERLFSAPYAPLLPVVIEALAVRLPPGGVAEVFRDMGRRLAYRVAGSLPLEGNLDARVTRSVGLLAELGGVFGAERESGGYALRGSRCPLAVVAPERAEVCVLTQALLTEVLGAPVHERCERSVPRCVFTAGTT